MVLELMALLSVEQPLLYGTSWLTELWFVQLWFVLLIYVLFLLFQERCKLLERNHTKTTATEAGLHDAGFPVCVLLPQLRGSVLKVGEKNLAKSQAAAGFDPHGHGCWYALLCVYLVIVIIVIVSLHCYSFF